MHNVDLGKGKSGVVDNFIELAVQLPFILLTALLTLLANLVTCRRVCERRQGPLNAPSKVAFRFWHSAWFGWVQMGFWWLKPVRW